MAKSKTMKKKTLLSYSEIFLGAPDPLSEPEVDKKITDIVRNSNELLELQKKDTSPNSELLDLVIKL